MKKLMALCLSVLMVLSMCSFTVMAEGTAVDFSAIANGQPANFVTGNLSLGENVITSSNEAVIATDGTVTRPIYEDATVSLTINGGEAVEVTVKAKTTNVLYSTDFTTDDAGTDASGNRTFANYSGFKVNTTGGTTTKVENGAMYADISNVSARTSLYVPTPTAGNTPVTVAFDINSVESTTATGAEVRFSITRYDADGKKIDSTASAAQALKFTSTNGLGQSGWAVSGTPTSMSPSIKYNPLTGEVWLNGKLQTNNLFTWNYTAEDTVARAVITDIHITNAGGGCTTQFYLDNYVAYEDVPAEEALAFATPAEKLANYSTLLDAAYVANGGDLNGLTGNLKFTADEELPADVTLSWTSTNPAIAADGTVKRPVLDVATATITGTLQVGEEKIVKSYDVTILPLTKAGLSEVVDFDSYNLANGAAIAQTGWASNATMTLTNTVDGTNSYATLAADASPGTLGDAVSYTFQKTPQAVGRYYVMEFDYRINEKISANAIGFALEINDKEIGKFVTRSNSTNCHPYIYKLNDPWYGNSTGLVYVSASSFVRLKMVVDTQLNTISYYANDVLKYSEARYDTADLTNISKVQLQISWRSATGSVSFDNVQVYSENTLEGILSTLSDAYKVDFYKQLIEASDIGTASSIGAVLDLDNGYADYAPATYGAAVNWASSNTAYIANDGTVAKLAAYGENVTVNMTATITVGNESATVVIPVAIPDITSVDTALHYAYDFTDYTAPDGAKYEIVADEDVAHGNVLKLDSTVGTQATIAHTAYGDGTRKDRFVIETDFKYDSASTGYPYFTVTTSAGAAGIRVYVNYSTGKVRLSTTKTALSKYDFTVSGGILVDYDMPESVKEKKGEWTHLLIDYNALSETYQVSIDGIVINEIPVLNAAIVPTRTGGSVRHILYNHSGTGVLYADNLSVKDYDDDNVIEVNAALNAALTLYASEIIHPALSNRTLWNKGIGLSWTNGTVFYKDESDLGNNPAGYKAVEDGPALTYKIGDNAVTAINVASPTEAEITITATKNGYSESKTFTRKLAPVVIETLSLGTENCLNGVWAEGATGTEKMILAKYLGGKLVTAEVIDFTVVKDTGSRYDAATGFVKDLAGYTNPKVTAAYDQVKLFVVDADGITPLAYANAELHD